MMDEKIIQKKLAMIHENSTYGITEEAQKLAEINHLKDEVAKLRRENEDLKKVLWAVADKVKDFKKEDKQ